MRENLCLFEFELGPNDLAALAAVQKGATGRIGPQPDTFDWVPA
jgi:2,5-diketo-D-gluconate reductase A